MRLKHVGVRPTHPLTLDFKKKIYYEECPNGKRLRWTKRMLSSGCDQIIYKPREMMGCFYCPWCAEWFSRDQWRVSDGND